MEEKLTQLQLLMEVCEDAEKLSAIKFIEEQEDLIEKSALVALHIDECSTSSYNCAICSKYRCHYCGKQELDRSEDEPCEECQHDLRQQEMNDYYGYIR